MRMAGSVLRHVEGLWPDMERGVDLVNGVCRRHICPERMQRMSACSLYLDGYDDDAMKRDRPMGFAGLLILPPCGPCALHAASARQQPPYTEDSGQRDAFPPLSHLLMPLPSASPPRRIEACNTRPAAAQELLAGLGLGRCLLARAGCVSCVVVPGTTCIASQHKQSHSPFPGSVSVVAAGRL